MKNKTVFEKVLLAVGMVCFSGIMIFGALYLFKVLENGLAYAEILLGVLMLVQGLMNVKKSKAVAIVSFAAAAFIFAVAIFILTI